MHSKSSPYEKLRPANLLWRLGWIGYGTIAEVFLKFNRLSLALLVCGRGFPRTIGPRVCQCPYYWHSPWK
eukprot:6102865-Lingulodinium_polyedra.AAC.1